ncbi:glycosyltransferase [Citrus sinensis]|uniref:Glycosyltransferase n=1 Tax=Citrus sinensis TaxID=2711 RepID=A0ACB8HRX9_CITSI|nr:glycosyltransferase [Citrus sinensis]
MKDTIVLYTSPGRGHLNSMVELGKLILTYHPCFSIDIIIPTAPFVTSAGTDDYIASVSATAPSVTFHQLPPPVSRIPDTLRSPADFPALVYELGELNNPNLHETLITISKRSNLKAFVIDFLCNPAFQVSSSTLSIPTYYYFTTAGSVLAANLYLPTLHKNTTKSFRELGSALLNFPGFPPFPARDMALPMHDREGKVYKGLVDTGIQMAKSAGIIVNTFELLQERAIKAMLEGQCIPGETLPPLYCIGPVVGRGNGENRGRDRHECLSWLDSKPSRSVLFLCFGSLGSFSSKQLKEMAIGLERSAPDSVENRSSLESLLPEGFLDRTKDRGLVVESWAPQVEVLNHESVGGFVTHCGWNSVLEGVCAGVPMLAWPLYAEQKMIKAVVVEEMKVGLAVTRSEEGDGLVSSAELEQRVSELMDSEKGRAVKERAVAMKEAAAAAMRDGGSSRVALDNLVESFKRGRMAPLGQSKQ